MGPFLSACLIVKNEERMLKNCLESLKDVLEEVIVVDTGSTDATKEIAKEFTDKIYDFEWKNNFSEARNFAASKATGEWIMAIDADENVDSEQLKNVIEEIKLHKNKFNAYLVEIISFSGEMGEITTVNQMARIYKNDGTVYYQSAIHEQLKPIKGDLMIALSSLKVYHYGYLSNVVLRQDKKNRNFNILEHELENADNQAFTLFNYGQELRRLNKREEALNHFVKAYACKGSVNEGWVRTCLFYIVECLVALKRYEEALAIVLDAEKLWPLAPDFIYWRGEIYLFQKRFDDAKEIYHNILTNRETYTDTIYHADRKSFLPYERLGQIYEMEKNDEKAIYHYMQALNENSLSIRVITKVIYILCEYNEIQDVYNFITTHNLIKTDTMRIEIIKYLSNIGMIELAKKMANDVKNERETLINIIQIKEALINSIAYKETTFTNENLLQGIQYKMLDLADLCILYEFTKDINLKNIMKHSNFSVIFNYLFEGLKELNGLDGAEYLSLLERACRYNKSDFAEKLFSLRHDFTNVNYAKIADVFYQNQYQDIAIELYELAHEKTITEQGYVNIIDWLIKNNRSEEAYHFSIKSIEKYKKDFRFYKYAIELVEEDRDGIMIKGLNYFPDSEWLKNNIILSI
ncbi:tetratricopeptide repeat-containing glycosyltransferase family 2 protein [Bacillus mobilis]